MSATGPTTPGAGRAGCVVPIRHPADAAYCVTSCWSERVGQGPCPAAIADKIDSSSLGTPEAKALRATVSDEHAARIVAMAREMEDTLPLPDDGEVEGLVAVMADAYLDTEMPWDLIARAVLAAGYRQDAARDAAVVRAALLALAADLEASGVGIIGAPGIRDRAEGHQ